MGHFYISLVMLAVQFGIFKEIISIKRDYNREKKIPVSSLLNWGIFILANFYFFFM